MKKNPEQEQIMQDMEAGRLSADGFLGSDNRTPEAIIDADALILDELEVTASNLGQLMRRLTRAGMTGLGDPVESEGYEITVDEWRGWMGCPFKDNRRAAKRITYLRRLSDNAKLQWTDMCIHLIGDHGFFQGTGSPRRLEPAELVEFLKPLL